jgi:hypothetical protein
VEPADQDVAPRRLGHLRLVWSNPHPPAPRRPLRLDLAIERHLAGADGLTDPEFLRIYSSAR